MAQVVFLLRADGAVGEKHERVLPRQPPDGVIGVDPRVHALAGCELGARRPQLCGEHGRAGAKRGAGDLVSQVIRVRDSRTLHYTMHGGDDLADVSRSRRHRHRFEASARSRRPSDSRRLRSLSGSQGAAASQLGGVSDRSASRIDAVILTHAHLDHCGYLPRLVGQGFRGRVFCTPGTRDLCTLVLPDSAHIQEEDARQANKHRYSKHVPALPLYTEIDAARALDRLQPVGYDRPVPVVPGVGGRVHQRRPSAGLCLRARQDRRQDDSVRRRSRPLRPAGPSRSDAGQRGRHPAGRIDLRRSAPRARRRWGAAGADRDRGRGAAADD